MRTHLLPGHEAGKVGEYAILVRARNVIPPCATYAAIFAHVSVAHVRMYVRAYVCTYVRTYESISKPSFRYHIFSVILSCVRAYIRTYVRPCQTGTTDNHADRHTNTHADFLNKLRTYVRKDVGLKP